MNILPQKFRGTSGKRLGEQAMSFDSSHIYRNFVSFIDLTTNNSGAKNLVVIQTFVKMAKYFLYSLLFVQLSFLIPSKTTSANLPPGFIEQVLAENLDAVNLVALPDGRILVAEKNGTVRIVKNGQLLSDPFLQIQVDNYNERGLQTIILDPDFEMNNYIYVFFSTKSNFNRVSRFTVNGDYALPTSETVIIDLDPLEGTIHNGGGMAFGKDGKIYIATGDSGNGTLSQNTNSLAGKVLRLNKDGSIPEDNPFYNAFDGKYKAIYALGFRNPFSMKADEITGNIYVNDVGSWLAEEINLLKAGKNYGWPTYEGYKTGQIDIENYENPVHYYAHTHNRCAITGGVFYQPQINSFPPEYWDKYFFLDYCSGELFYLDPASGEVQGTLATNLKSAVALAITTEGQMIYLQRGSFDGSTLDGSVESNTTTSTGTLVMITYTGNGAPFISRHPKSQTIPVGEPVQFSVIAYGNQPLSYSWVVNGTVIDNDSSIFIIEDTELDLDSATVYCIVSNEFGKDTSDIALLRIIDNHRPVATINEPSAEYKYKAGDTIFFSGSGFDEEDGILDASQLTWWIDFHHDSHKHPALGSFTGSSGSYVIPRIGETSDNVWYRIYLSITDSEGLTHTIYREIYPQKATITVKTHPENLSLQLDGKKFSGDTTFTSVTGILRSLKAFYGQFYNDKIYAFDSWDNSDTDITYNFYSPESDTTIVANFIEVSRGDGDGLNSYYYNSETNFLLDSIPDLITKGNIHFDWGNGAPEGIRNDLFFARYKGWLEPLVTGEYTFTATSDDGSRLWIDDQLIIDDWEGHPKLSKSGNIFLERGKKYPIVLEYFEAWGGAYIQLEWAVDLILQETVPVSQLYSKITNIVPGSETLVNIYPNPSENFITIVSDTISLQKIEIFTLEGSLVKTIESINNNKINIFLNELHPGLYIIKTTTESFVVRSKIIKK